MTFEELVKMTGSEEQANFALKQVLANVKVDFVRSCINIQIDKVESDLKETDKIGVTVWCNGTRSVNWIKDFDGIGSKANANLYLKNRLLSLIAYR